MKITGTLIASTTFLSFFVLIGSLYRVCDSDHYCSDTIGAKLFSQFGNATESSEAQGVNAFRDAVNAAMAAAELTQAAVSTDEWNQVIDLWNQASYLMSRVPQSSEKYAIAHTKVKEYQFNADYAHQQLLIAPEFSAPQDCSTATSLNLSNDTEPVYTGQIGYAVVNRLDIDWMSQNLLAADWQVPIYTHSNQTHSNQAHSNQADSDRQGIETIPHKTRVEVLEQDLRLQRPGVYTGVLQVRDVRNPTQSFLISPDNFVPLDYWNCAATEASKFGPFIAQMKLGSRPTSSIGQKVQPGAENRVVCRGLAGIGSPHGSIACLLYKEYRSIYQGVIHYFHPQDLEIIY